MGSGDHSAGPQRGFMRSNSTAPQGDAGGSKLPHLLTGVVTLVLTLVVGHYTSVLQGQQGPKGTSVVITKTDNVDGLCAYFGPDARGRVRLQITTPKNDTSGPWCAKGTYVSVVPGR